MSLTVRWKSCSAMPPLHNSAILPLLWLSGSPVSGEIGGCCVKLMVSVLLAAWDCCVVFLTIMKDVTLQCLSPPGVPKLVPAWWGKG